MVKAVIILGPTGAGKTPVGEVLEQGGLWGRRAHHFDFGANLRAIAGGDVPSPALPRAVANSAPEIRRGARAGMDAQGSTAQPEASPYLQRETAIRGFSREEVLFLGEVLAKGVLLEAESFYLAVKILKNFMERRRVGPEDWVIMNGLPRHVGQAEALADYLRVEAVIELELTAEVVLERLRTNVGGDRGERSDDSEELVRRKLAIYEERTRPLVEWYRERGGRVIRIAVGARTTAEETLREMTNVQ